MKTHLNCPCGEVLVGSDEDQLVALTQKHLAEMHSSREYSREAILAMAW
ncbi:hypothetical protein ABH922_005580 [Rhodococcus sp. 27YEA15]